MSDIKEGDTVELGFYSDGTVTWKSGYVSRPGLVVVRTSFERRGKVTQLMQVKEISTGGLSWHTTDYCHRLS